MKRGTKIALAGGIAACAIAAGTKVAVFVLSLDEDPPDDLDLLLVVAPAPAEENGVWQMSQANQMIEWPEGPEGEEASRTLVAILDGGPWNEPVARGLLDRNRRALAMAEEALRRPRFQFPEYEVGMNVGGWRRIGQLKCLRAMDLARQGRQDEAFHEALAVVRLGHRIEQGRGSIVYALLGPLFKGQGAQRIEAMLSTCGLPWERLKDIARQYGRCVSEREAVADAFRLEYTYFAGEIDRIAGGPPGARGHRSTYVFQPNRTKRTFAVLYRHHVRNVTCPYAEIGPPLAKPMPSMWDGLKPNGVGRLLFAIALIGTEETARSLCRDRVSLGAVHVLIALRAFRAREGRLPTTLGELAPEFLDALPLDLDGRPLRYSPDKKVVYSVGKDLKDDGGMTAEEARQWWRQEDPYTAKEQPDPEPVCLPDPSWPIEF